MGVVVRRYIDFHILLIPTPLVSLLQHPYFLFIKKNVFRSCSSSYIFEIYLIIFIHSISEQKDDYGRPTEAV